MQNGYITISYDKISKNDGENFVEKLLPAGLISKKIKFKTDYAVNFFDSYYAKYTQNETAISKQEQSITSENARKVMCINNISRLLYYVQYLQNEIISRTYEGIFINTSLQDFRAGMAYNLKLKQMKTLPQSEGTEAEDMVYRKTILSKLIPGSTDHYCGHTYGDIPLSIHFNESKISSKTDIIHELINLSIPASDGGSPNELPEPIDINYCFMLVINNSKEANDPPRTAFIDTNLLKREYYRLSTRNLTIDRNFLFIDWPMHTNVQKEFITHSFLDIEKFRSNHINEAILNFYEIQIEKIYGYGKGITTENTTKLLDYITKIREILPNQGQRFIHDYRESMLENLNSLLLELDSLNAPSLIGTCIY